MKTTTVAIGDPSPRQICSNAGLLAFARTATNLAVADTIDDALTGQQNPNLTHTVGSTMTSLALALILGADDVSDIDLLGPLVATGLVTCAGVGFHDPPTPPRTHRPRRSGPHPAGGGDENHPHPGMEPAWAP